MRSMAAVVRKLSTVTSRSAPSSAAIAAAISDQPKVATQRA
ncbi:Uncharacterised protein [Mycobacteroides abscessus subsp. abscessus]|nr:Uncharacterised protein [Mycobacteroides abscessus subsp. abscessus]